jgi:hypothetical protein
MSPEDAAALISILRCYECGPPDIDWISKEQRIQHLLEKALTDRGRCDAAEERGP